MLLVGIHIISNLSVNYGSLVGGFDLNGVYPNPFNPSTTINFTVSENIDLNISIYDMQGRQIESIVNSRYIPGLHSVSWDASDYSSGIYFARLSSANYEKTQKLMLIK